MYSDQRPAVCEIKAYNMIKSIWIINQYACTFQDGNPSRSYFMAKYLADESCETRLFAATYSHLHRLKRRKPRHEAIDKNARLTWINVLPYYKAQSLVRMINWFIFALQIALLPVRSQKPDIIIYSSPSPVGYLGCYLLAKRTGAKLVFDIRDIWPLTLIELGKFSAKNPFIMLLAKIERFACQTAHLITSNLPGCHAYLEQAHLRSDKFLLIKNGYDHSAFTSSSNTSSTDRSPEKDTHLVRYDTSNFIIGYIGSIGLSNKLDILIEAANLVKDQSHIHFQIIGSGSHKSYLQHKVAAYQLTNVTFSPPVPKQDIVTHLTSFDLCYIGWLNANLYRYGIAANKLPEYMSSATPILQSYSGDYDPVTEYDCGWTVPAENPKLLAEMIIRLSQVDQSLLQEAGERGQKAALQHYDYATLIAQLKAELKKL